MHHAGAFKTYYDLLGISETATQDEIRAAMRKLSMEYHPDRNPDPKVADLYKVIATGYDVLSDPERRKRYDAIVAQRRAPRRVVVQEAGELSDIVPTGGFGWFTKDSTTGHGTGGPTFSDIW